MLDTARIATVINESIAVKELVIEQCSESILSTGKILANCLNQGGKIMFCGNGGSAADAQHIAAELVIRFRGSVERAPLPAMALSVDPSLMTAGGNDYGFENVYARAVQAFAKPEDVVVGITTSGTSSNVKRAIGMGNYLGIKTIGLLGSGGGTIAQMCVDSVIVPSSITARIQESHIMIGHIWCEIIEEMLFPELFNK